jgi:hypothetical protein
MARDTKTYFKAILAAFLAVVVDLYYSVKENAFSWLKSGKFLIYFENAVWSVNESEFENVYNAWMAI